MIPMKKGDVSRLGRSARMGWSYVQKELSGGGAAMANFTDERSLLLAEQRGDKGEVVTGVA
jgi:hypothetical protein